MNLYLLEIGSEQFQSSINKTELQNDGYSIQMARGFLENLKTISSSKNLNMERSI